jgi:hypothetical protein
MAINVRPMRLLFPLGVEVLGREEDRFMFHFLLMEAQASALSPQGDTRLLRRYDLDKYIHKKLLISKCNLMHRTTPDPSPDHHQTITGQHWTITGPQTINSNNRWRGAPPAAAARGYNSRYGSHQEGTFYDGGEDGGSGGYDRGDRGST